MNTTYEEAWGEETDGGDSRKRRSRLLVVLLLLLLLFVFLLGVFSYLLFLAPPRTVQKGKFEFLFSLYGMSRPMASAIDGQGNIYVTNNGTSEIYKFNKEGDFLTAIKGKKRAEKIYAENGIYADANRIYIADFTGSKVHVFSQSGKALFRFPTTNLGPETYGSKGFTPFGIVGYKDKLYVTSNDGVYIYSKKGKLLDSWRGHGMEANQFDYANSIAVDKRDGTFFVSDVLNRRIKALDKNGKVKWIIGRPDEHGAVKSLFSLPRGMAFNEKRNLLYVIDTFVDKVIVLSKDGKLVSVLGERGVDDGQFNFPEGITYVGNDTVHVIDRENNRLQALRITKFPLPPKKDRDNYRGSFIKFPK